MGGVVVSTLASWIEGGPDSRYSLLRGGTSGRAWWHDEAHQLSLAPHAHGTAVASLVHLQFGAGWWVFIDGYGIGVNVANDAAASATAGYSWLPLFGATLAYIMVNGMKWTELKDDYVDSRVAAKARIFLLSALLIMIGSMAGAAVLMVDKFLKDDGSYKWAGISSFVGTMLIILATWIQRFGTLPPEA